jgi:glycosyltransferase involved in cell wall biosynthesis
VVKDAIDSLGTEDNLGAAQSHIPEAVLDWLGADGIIIFHHYLDRLFDQWAHLADWRSGGGRCVWRTVGQSVAENEAKAQHYVADGLEVVRYSPKERNLPNFAGEDALIRFYKDENEWAGWTGEHANVINITQELQRRDPWTNFRFWQLATEGLPAVALGPGTGTGVMPLATMQRALREARCYLYTGTQPASYTLGLLEALMTGIPTVSIGPEYMTIFPYGPAIYEGLDLCGYVGGNPGDCRTALSAFLSDREKARAVSKVQRARTVAEFGMEAVGRAWSEFLG